MKGSIKTNYAGKDEKIRGLKRKTEKRTKRRKKGNKEEEKEDEDEGDWKEGKYKNGLCWKG